MAETKVVQVVCALVWCILAAGPVFGFAALKPVLIAQGVYQDRCSNLVPQLNSQPCLAQDLSLNYLFTLAAVVTNVASLLVGALLDKYGPRITGILGSGLIFLALLVLANGYWLVQYFDAYLVGYCALALGGPFVFISCFQLANAFPGNSGLILALLTGAFDSSSALFLVYRLTFFSSLGDRLGLSLARFFSCYLVVPVFIFVCQMTIMPSESYQTVISKDTEAIEVADAAEEPTAYVPIPVVAIRESDTSELINSINENLSRSLNSQHILTDQYAHTRSNSFTQKVMTSRRSSIASNLNQAAQDVPPLETSRLETLLLDASLANNKSMAASVISGNIAELADNEFARKSGISGSLHGALMKQQVLSTWFVLMALFTSIQMLRINYFVATVRSQEEYLLQDPVAAKIINEFFDLALPIGGLVSIPFIGILLDNFKTITVMGILLGVSLSIGILGIIPFASANYLGIMLMVVYRPFYYTAVSDYCAKVFGFKTFGTIYGSIICISGLFNLIQTFLDNLTHFTFHMNPTPVNSILTTLTGVIGGALILFIFGHKEKKAVRSGYGAIE